MSSDGAAAATTDAGDGKCRSSTQDDVDSKTPPTPPGSPVDRPFPAAAPVYKNVLQMIREEGDGCRHGKPGSRTAKKSASHRSTNTDLPPRQPSDGYQILDDVPGAGELPAGSSSDQHSDHRHQHQQQQQHQPGASSTSSSDDSSSEFDWSEDEADSSDANSVDEVNRPARAAADGMSSGTESECLL